MRELCNGPGIWERKLWGNRRDKPLSCLYWERDEREKGISICTALLKHGDQMPPETFKSFSLYIINQLLLFRGTLIEIKKKRRCFNKAMRFSSLYPFFFWKYMKKYSMRFYYVRRYKKIPEAHNWLCEKFLNIMNSLPDCMRTAASSLSFLICLRFCRATWPLQARDRQIYR